MKIYNINLFSVIVASIFISLASIQPRYISIYTNGSVILLGLPILNKFNDYKNKYDGLYFSYFLLSLISSLLPGNLSPAEGILYTVTILMSPLYIINYLLCQKGGIDVAVGKLLKIISYSYLLLITYAMVTITPNELSNRVTLHTEFSPANIGKYSGLSFLIFLFLYFEEKKKIYIIYSIYSFTLLLLTFSKGSILSIVLVVIILPLIIGQNRSVKNIISVICIVGPVFYYMYDFIANKWLAYSANTENLESFTGRIALWTKIWDMIQTRVLFGYGYHSPSVILSYGFVWGEDIYVGQAHNFIMQSILNVGIIGTLLLTILIVMTIIDLIKLKNKCGTILAYKINTLIVILIFLVIRSFTEATFAQAGSMDIVYLGIIVTIVKILTNKIVMQRND